MDAAERENWAVRFEKAKNRSTWNVMVDGNRRKETQGIRIETDKGPVTVKKCLEICGHIRDRFGFVPETVKIFMWDFDYRGIDLDTYIYAMYGDCSIPMSQQKTAKYEMKRNRLTIFEDGMPIYCNDDGHVCSDADALADCMYD